MDNLGIWETPVFTPIPGKLRSRVDRSMGVDIGTPQRGGREAEETITIMCAGACGAGKSNLLSAIFASPFSNSKRLGRTRQISESTMSFSADGRPIKLNLIDTPGFDFKTGTREGAFDMVQEFLESRFRRAWNLESKGRRQRKFGVGVDAILYTFRPNRIDPEDLEFLQVLQRYGAIVPVVTKADALTSGDLALFKQRLAHQLQSAGIETFCPPLATVAPQFQVNPQQKQHQQDFRLPGTSAVSNSQLSVLRSLLLNDLQRLRQVAWWRYEEFARRRLCKQWTQSPPSSSPPLPHHSPQQPFTPRPRSGSSALRSRAPPHTAAAAAVAATRTTGNRHASPASPASKLSMVDNDDGYDGDGYGKKAAGERRRRQRRHKIQNDGDKIKIISLLPILKRRNDELWCVNCLRVGLAGFLAYRYKIRQDHNSGNMTAVNLSPTSFFDTLKKLYSPGSLSSSSSSLSPSATTSIGTAVSAAAPISAGSSPPPAATANTPPPASSSPSTTSTQSVGATVASTAAARRGKDVIGSSSTDKNSMTDKSGEGDDDAEGFFRKRPWLLVFPAAFGAFAAPKVINDLRWVGRSMFDDLPPS
eukprot:jgi/Bigna1/88448/estExt_fgenesh1_pg.C_320052